MQLRGRKARLLSCRGRKVRAWLSCVACGFQGYFSAGPGEEGTVNKDWSSFFPVVSHLFLTDTIALFFLELSVC